MFLTLFRYVAIIQPMVKQTSKPNTYTLQLRLTRSTEAGALSASKDMLDQLVAHHGVTANQVIRLALRAFHHATFPALYGEQREGAGAAFALTLDESQEALQQILLKRPVDAGHCDPKKSNSYNPDIDGFSGGPGAGAGQSPPI